jgi:polysaccharide biosynthesis protein PslH
LSKHPGLLFVSPRYLFPLDQGGKIRTANILRGLRGGAFHVTLASPVPAKLAHSEAEIAAMCDRFISWPAPVAGTARRAMMLADSLPVAVASDRSAAGAALIAREIAGTDLLLADFPHSVPLLPKGWSAPPRRSVMFTHNVEAEIFARHAEVARGPMRLVWQDQARKMRRFEAEALRQFTSVIAVSTRDADALRAAYDLPRVEVIDTGVDLDFHAFQPPNPPPEAGGGTVVFTGAMDWRANIDGIEFLMNEVWPILLRSHPGARALIVGRNPRPEMIEAARGRGLDFTFTGYVDDIRPHVATGDVYIIPLRVGSGTRIKAFEAMASGRPVVSTTLGVEGLDVVPGEHFLRADDADSFAASIGALLSDPARAQSMARAARSLVEARFGWDRVARQFEDICLRALAG